MIADLARWIRELLGPWTGDPWLQAAAVVAAAAVAAVIVDRVVTLVVRLVTRRTKSGLDDVVVGALHKPVVATVLFYGLAVVAKVLQPGPEGARTTFAVLATLALLMWTVCAFRVGVALLQAGVRNERRFQFLQDATFPLFSIMFKLVAILVAAYVAISIWEVDATGWLASAGIIGIAVGFAAQDSLANLFAGVFILADKPYSVGEYIRLDSGERGKVTFIGLRSTRLLTRDDIEICIPNSVMGSAKIINEHGGPHRKERVRVPVGVAYGTDVDRARAVMLAAVEDVDWLEKDPVPRVRFRAFGASSLDFELLVWIPDPEMRGLAMDLLLTAVYKGFAENGIEIPFSQHDVYLKHVPEGLLPGSARAAAPPGDGD